MNSRYGVRAVVFDVGETLVDETRAWSSWADWLGIPRFTLLAALGGVIARDRHHREVFQLFRPGIDVNAEDRRRRAAGIYSDITIADLYPDALPCIRELQEAGLRVGVAANQPASTEAAMRTLGIRFDLVASSAVWGLEKPDPAFFARVVGELGLPPGEIAYVGDRIDNDVVPAARAGMISVFLRRGPWAWIQAGRERPVDAAISIDSLAELPTALSRMAARQ